MTHNLYAALEQGMRRQPAEAVAIETDTGARYTWAELDALSARLAHGLRSWGLREGARVAVQVEKSVEAMALYLATLRAGYVFLPLNTAYQANEMAYFLQDAAPEVLVCSPDHMSWLEPLAQAAGATHRLTLGVAADGSLLEAVREMPTHFDTVPRAANDLAAILYTSGTTGRSKGAMLTHGNLLSNAQMLQSYWDWRADDVLIHALPIFHVHGLFVAIHAALINGSPMRWMGRFDAQRCIGWMADATVFMGVPTLYVRMLAEPSLTPAAVRRMRVFISGSAPLLMDTFRAWEQRTGHVILERYGMSETLMLTSNPCQADARYGGQSERRGGTVGFPLPGVDLRVAGEGDQTLAVGDIGGIQVRGPNVFVGYWQMPEKTREEFTADGWFRTGDVGWQDDRGYVTIVGRSKDLIISGGYNVYPAEIEGYLNAMPGVAESAVIGVPDPEWGEVGVALVVPRPGQMLQPQQLLDALRPLLARFKQPKVCELVTELPRNTMGKVQKNLLRQQYAERLTPQR